MKNIYIILSQTGTIVSTIIRRYTHDPYNHASIAFDRSLEVMYSFGRKRRYNVLNNGFIEENFSKGLFAVFPNAKCLVLEINVTDEQYQTMLESVNSFLRRKEMYRYNIVGLLGYLIGVGLAPRDQFFCSQFVAYVLGRTEVWRGIPELTKPMDFLEIIEKSIVFEGSIRDYRLFHAMEEENQKWQTGYKRVLSLAYLLAKLRGTRPWKMLYQGRHVLRSLL